jgi:hypothetical protein
LKSYILVIFSFCILNESYGSNLDEFLKLSNFKIQINNIPNSSRESILRKDKNLPPGHAKKIGDAVFESLDGSNLFRMFVKKVKQQSTDELFKKNLIASKTKIGLKSTKAGTYASSQAGGKEFRKYLSSIVKKQPPQDRIIKIINILKISGAIQAAQSQAIRMSLLIAIGMNTAAPKKSRKKMEVVLKDQELKAAEIKKKSFQEITLFGLFMYRNFSDNELKEYIQLYENEKLQETIILLGNVLNEVLDISMRDFPFLVEGKFINKNIKIKVE